MVFNFVGVDNRDRHVNTVDVMDHVLEAYVRLNLATRRLLRFLNDYDGTCVYHSRFFC